LPNRNRKADGVAGVAEGELRSGVSALITQALSMQECRIEADITDAEKQYVQNNLDEVNERRERAGHDPIDPTDPKMAEKYGLSAQQPDAVEEEMQDQANL